MGTRENKFQSSDKLCKLARFISPVLSSVSHEVQNLFWTFGVARNIVIHSKYFPVSDWLKPHA